MIPLKLALRNFMCYRENVPPLHFNAIHIACLCGNNGNGKSALLDAITWALWGETRAKRDDELVHLGKTEMEVEFEFAVAGDHYRVIRKHTKGTPRRPGQTTLDLFIADGQGFTLISGNSLRETQRKITESLRMNYETFINSAFLVQGRADEFTKKQPAERREVLAAILGLSFYDELAEKAKELAKKSEAHQRELSSVIAVIDRQLSQREDFEIELGKATERLLELDSQVKTCEDELNALRQKKDNLERRKEQLDEVESRIKLAEGEISYLEEQVSAHQKKIAEYEMALASYQQRSDRIRLRIGELLKLEQELVEKREKSQAISNRIHLLTSTNAKLKQEMKELKEKLDLLSREEARCPLCGAELGVKGRKRIIENFEAQGQEKASAYRTNEAEARQAEQELNALKQKLAGLERTITTERAQCERQEEALAKEHAEAESFLPKEREALGRSEEALSRKRSAIKDDKQKRATLLAEVTDLPTIKNRLAEAQRTFDSLRERRDAAYRALITAQANLARCAHLEEMRKENVASLKKASEEKAIYDELANAFGKKGIQALIIEEALPEIEEEANRLLARMTDSRMSVKIETQRETRKGELVETLDIKIADGLGTRSYEMFSGGEAFRINFALRIALSRLLARRAGAPLPTLFIDEGFGTQDSSGRERLVEAINSIQDDFEKIIVITHIDELKDAFPTRIEVTKTAEGSMIKVI